ncbi:MAG: aromatic ring-hydroxylating dioxygenase subunit alpha [Pseudomonadota bacterium]
MNANHRIRFEPGLKTLDPEYYTGETAYAQARTEVFFKSWQFACHQSQVTQPGDYVCFSIFDQDLVVVRGNDDQLRCFYNVCQHRGHTLLQGSGNSRVVVCPYHAWTYELSGEFRGAPGTRNLLSFDGSAICLSSVKLDVFCGFVFVNLDEHARSISESYPGVEKAVRAVCPDIEKRLHADKASLIKHSNWLVAVENYNECYHCKNVHSALSSGVVEADTYNVAAFFSDDGQAAPCLRHTAKAQSGDGSWYDTSGSDYCTFYLWPAFGLQIYPSGLVNTYHWRPIGIDKTEVTRDWYSQNGEVDDTLRSVIDLDRNTTVAEDAELVKNVQRGLNSMGYKAGQLVLNPEEGIDSEHSIAALHQWVRAAITL